MESPHLFKVQIQCTLEKQYVENHGGRSSSGERLSFGESFEFEARNFAEVAEVLGKFQQVAERIRLEGHARFRDE